MSNTAQDKPRSHEQQLSGSTEQHQSSLAASPMMVDSQAFNAADPLLEIKEGIRDLSRQLTLATSVLVRSNAQEAKDSVQDLHDRLALARSTLKELQATCQALDRQPAALAPASVSPNTTSSEHSQDGYSAASNRSDHAPSYLPRSPEGLPFIQWKSQVFKHGEKKFEDPQICLNYFEVILKLNFIDLDQHWKRMVLPKVSDTMMDWVVAVPDETTWFEFKQLFLARYGHSPEMVQADAKQKLMTLSMGRNESITEYIDRFEQLRKKVDLLDSDPILQRALLDPLSADLRRTLIVFNSLNNDATASLEPISDTIVKIKSIYTLFENQNSWDRLADAFTPSKQTDRKSHRDRRDKRRVREHKPYDRNDSKHTEKTSRTYCSYHKLHGHHTNDCRAKGNQPLKCFKCAKPIVKGQLHKCSSTADSKYNPHRHHDRSSRDRKQKKSRKKNIVPTPASSSDKDTDMEDATDSDQDQNLTVKSTKKIIVKMLNGYDESWDLYVNSTALAMNCHYSRLHHMKPFCGMFSRQPNAFHSGPVDSNQSFPGKPIDHTEFIENLKHVDEILVPAIKEQIERTQKADNAYFMKRHKILQNPFPTGSAVMIKNVEGKNSKTDPLYDGPFTTCGRTKNGSYILKDRTDALLSRDASTSSRLM